LASVSIFFSLVNDFHYVIGTLNFRLAAVCIQTIIELATRRRSAVVISDDTFNSPSLDDPSVTAAVHFYFRRK
jgi:hypothetical protein